VHILFKQQKKLTLFLLGGFSLLAGLVLIVTATIGAKPARAGDLPSSAGSTITFNKQGGTGGTSSITIKVGDYVYPNCNSFSGTKTPIPGFVAPTREGYRFDGYYEWWNDTDFIDSNGYWLVFNELVDFEFAQNRIYVINNNGYWVLDRDITLRAIWTRMPDHTIALPPQSGTGWILVS